METIKITENQLVGDIKNFPIEVVTKMVEYQVAQGCAADVSVFTSKRTSSSMEGGFTWDNTEEGFEFWYNVIGALKFNVFFQKFPKKEEKSKYVYIVGDRHHDVIAELEKRGGSNDHEFIGDNEEWLYYIDPTTSIIECCDTDEVFDNKLYEMLMTFYTPIEIETVEEDKTVEVSMEEIAKMMGVDVSNLRIKE